jgi:hypothetical protein
MTTGSKPDGAPPDGEARPPLGKWSRMYALVLVTLAAVIGACALVTAIYR